MNLSSQLELVQSMAIVRMEYAWEDECFIVSVREQMYMGQSACMNLLIVTSVEEVTLYRPLHYVPV